MQDLNDLYYFVQVVDHGGFAPAGRALGMPKSKLSRRIALLEERLGARLLQRTTRHFSVTDVGQTFYEHCKAMLVEAEAAQDAIDLTWAAPRGTVRLSCPIALLHSLVAPMLAGFMRAHPQVTLLLEASNRRVDLVAEGIDVAIRVRPPPLPDSDLVLRVLAERSQCMVGSPLLFAARARAATAPADLADWPSLALGTPQQQYQWDLFGPDGARAQLGNAALRHGRLADPARRGRGRRGRRAVADHDDHRAGDRWQPAAADGAMAAAARNHSRRLPLAARPASRRARLIDYLAHSFAADEEE